MSSKLYTIVAEAYELILSQSNHQTGIFLEKVSGKEIWLPKIEGWAALYGDCPVLCDLEIS